MHNLWREGCWGCPEGDREMRSLLRQERHSRYGKTDWGGMEQQWEETQTHKKTYRQTERTGRDRGIERDTERDKLRDTEKLGHTGRPGRDTERHKETIEVRKSRNRQGETQRTRRRRSERDTQRTRETSRYRDTEKDTQKYEHTHTHAHTHSGCHVSGSWFWAPVGCNYTCTFSLE